MGTLRLAGLTKRYARAPDAPSALSSLDLTVEDGELLVLVGPSGCGKSTALRLIAGLEQPDEGVVELAGRDLADVPPQERDVAMVFQGYALYPHMTARQIMAFPLQMRGVPAGERHRRVAEIAEMMGLTTLLDRRPAELSGGEQQRVAMGRAIVRDPQVFLFDEPLSNLDAKLRAELRVELSALVRRLGTTAVYVTHDQAEAMTMGDRVAVLKAGVLQQVGPPRQIYERPANAFVAGFLGTPAMNLLELTRDGELWRRSGFAVAPPPELVDAPAELILGVRPEHVEVGAEGEGAGVELPAEVVSSEPLGAETTLHLRVGDALLRARTPGFDDRQPGSPVVLRLPARRLMWFDAASGTRLWPPSEAR